MKTSGLIESGPDKITDGFGIWTHLAKQRKDADMTNGIASDGDRADADPVLDEAAVSISDAMLAGLKERTDALGDTIVAMETSADRGTAEADFEREFLDTVKSLAGMAVDHMRRTAGPAKKAAATMLRNAPTHEQLATRRARQLVFDRLGSADTSGLLAAGRVFFER